MTMLNHQTIERLRTLNWPLKSGRIYRRLRLRGRCCRDMCRPEQLWSAFLAGNRCSRRTNPMNRSVTIGGIGGHLQRSAHLMLNERKRTITTCECGNIKEIGASD
jgi:hypothetical protein